MQWPHSQRIVYKKVSKTSNLHYRQSYKFKLHVLHFCNHITNESLQELTLSTVNDTIAVTAAVIVIVLCTLWRQWYLTRHATPSLRALTAIVSAGSYYNTSFKNGKSSHASGWHLRNISNNNVKHTCSAIIKTHINHSILVRRVRTCTIRRSYRHCHPCIAGCRSRHLQSPDRSRT